MDVLPLHFRVLYYGGLWWESDEQHWLVKYIWKPFIVNVIFFCALTMMSPLAAPNNDIKDVPKFLFLSLTVFSLLFKIAYFLAKRQSMIELLNQFREPICAPQTPEERDILRRNARLIPIVMKFYWCSACSSITIFLLLPVLQSIKDGTRLMSFPYETYEIFSKENLAYYSVTYAFQIVASFVGITLHAALDTMFAGFARLACGQIELCCHRFAAATRDSVLDNVKMCVAHQVVIRKIVRRVESTFMGVVVPFLAVSLVVICTSVYNLSRSGLGNVESFSFLVYTAAILAQVFYYCWFGNELKLKGIKISETLYNYDWRALRPVERKQLLFIMTVCQKPLSLSYHGYCAISLDIYVWILNASYAAYNILQAVMSDN